MFRKTILAVAATLALGVAALTPTAASAKHFGGHGFHGGHGFKGWHGGHFGWRHHGWYRGYRGYGVYGVYAGDCYLAMTPVGLRRICE
jgi:hypothetical protein